MITKFLCSYYFTKQKSTFITVVFIIFNTYSNGSIIRNGGGFRGVVKKEINTRVCNV